jgi:hypothetical protein
MLWGSAMMATRTAMMPVVTGQTMERFFAMITEGG